MKRVAGSPWRVLAHGYGPDGETHSIEVPDTEFDELVVGQWIHIEQMSNTTWWMCIGGVTVWVRVGRNGKPRSVSVFGPGVNDGPVEGCDYKLAWSES